VTLEHSRHPAGEGIWTITEALEILLLAISPSSSLPFEFDQSLASPEDGGSGKSTGQEILVSPLAACDPKPLT